MLPVYLILIVCAAGALTLAGRQSAAVKPLPRSVQLKAADAQRLATAARNGVTVEMPAGLELKLWASDELIVDPVALEFDDKGTLYATSTSRNNMPLDIREHPTWVPTVHTLKTVSDLREFYRRELAPDRSNQNKWLPDLNQDGSHDERDLAELKDRVYRIRDTDGDGIADSSQILIEGFNADPTFDVAGGLLYNQGDLLVGIAPGIYRLKDDNGDGTIDRQIAISEGYTIHPAFGGHGISGLTMGPDGRLYWEVGDIGYDVTDKSGKRWSQHNQGGVFRSDPDGSNFEVFATGIRNLQEFSFDKSRQPDQRRQRRRPPGRDRAPRLHPEGSDSGWRSNWQYGKYTDAKNNRYNVWMDENMFKPRFAGQAAHILPPVAAYHSGPSGMVYNPGTALSEEWNDTFFVTSFPGAASNARVYAFKLKEDGAGFALESDKVLLRGILAVGLKFGLDGAMYVTDWITGWDSKNRGRIWKLDTPATAGSAQRKEVQTLLGENFSDRAAGGVSTLLAHADMRVRQKAQFELVRRNDSATLTAAAKCPRKSARARSCDLGPGAAGAQEPDAGRVAPALPDRRRRRDPRPGGEDARRHALRRGGAGVDDDGRRRGGQAAVLCDGSARPPGPQAGDPAHHRDARRQRRQGRLPAPRRRPRAGAHWRRPGDRGAVDASVEGCPDRGDQRAAPAAQRRAREVHGRQRRADRAGDRPGDQRRRRRRSRAAGARQGPGGHEVSERAAAAARDQRQPSRRYGGCAGAPGDVRRRLGPAGGDAGRGGGGAWRLPVTVADGPRRRLLHRAAGGPRFGGGAGGGARAHDGRSILRRPLPTRSRWPRPPGGSRSRRLRRSSSRSSRPTVRRRSASRRCARCRRSRSRTSTKR